jgi:tetratricopeptide (TPR) repeat protein
MPKPIKKKVPKQALGAEESVRTYMSVVTEKIETNFKQVVIGAAVVLGAVVLVAGLFIYGGSAEKRSKDAFYEGYKSYHGLYDAQVLTKFERYERALESFKKSYDIQHTPQALLYMANAQHGIGKHDEAIKSIEELVSGFPEDNLYISLALYKAAMVNQKAGKAEEALKSLERLYALESDFYKDAALVESARILDGMGKEDEALKKYETILEKFPNSTFIDEAKFRTGKDKEEEKGNTEESGS